MERSLGKEIVAKKVLVLDLAGHDQAPSLIQSLERRLWDTTASP